MDASTLEKIGAEIGSAAIGRVFGRIFQLSRFEVAVDLRIPDSRYLFISFEPADPRVYLIRRRLKDLERASGNLSPLSLTLRKRLSNAKLNSVERLAGERILELSASAVDEFGENNIYTLLLQLTGRSANLFLLDGERVIIDSARESAFEGQAVGDQYAPPPSGNTREIGAVTPIDDAGPSETLDSFYLERKAEQRFASLVNAARNRINAEASKRLKLIGKLDADLAAHGDAEKWKRLGDLLLANSSTARREGGKIFITDYYDEKLAEIAVTVEENVSVTEAAELFFKKYTKARNAAKEVAARREKLNKELAAIEQQRARLESAITSGDEGAISEFAGSAKPKPAERSGSKANGATSGTRSFFSTDGFEILVGKKAADNDFLTFRVAKSLDTWMHAADYPGSHVVIRNPNRKEVPQRTLLEAAQLAAFYSQGRSQTKAAVHYTQKKFVNKPKGAAAGLVSLSSFKTILVVPDFPSLPEPASGSGSVQ